MRGREGEEKESEVVTYWKEGKTDFKEGEICGHGRKDYTNRKKGMKMVRQGRREMKEERF